jgi:hypothetical protein
VPVNGKPIAILELGGLPSEIINVVVSVLARLAFDFGVWSAGRIPITFVCEEAHRYVPNDKTLGFEPTKRAISKIAKEGRKYGVSLCIVTQRPAELDPTILSQCNTIFSLRLTNEKRPADPAAGISDAAASLLEFMPTMGTGEAITFGEGVALPTRIKFDMLPVNELPQEPTRRASPRTGRRTCPTTASCRRSCTAGGPRPTIRTPQATIRRLPQRLLQGRSPAMPRRPPLPDNRCNQPPRRRWRHGLPPSRPPSTRRSVARPQVSARPPRHLPHSLPLASPRSAAPSRSTRRRHRAGPYPPRSRIWQAFSSSSARKLKRDVRRGGGLPGAARVSRVNTLARRHKRGYQHPAPTRRTHVPGPLLGDRLTVGPRTLTPLV